MPVRSAVGADVGDVDDAGEPGDGAQDLLGGQVPDLDIVILGVAEFELPRTCTIGAEIRGISCVARLQIGLGAERARSEHHRSSDSDGAKGHRTGNRRARHEHPREITV